MAGEDCACAAAAAVGPDDDGSGRNSSMEEEATVAAAVGVVTALQTEWLAKRVRISFRRRRLR